MYKLYFGLTVLLSTIIPSAYLLRLLSGGMYGVFFKGSSPAIYVSINMVVSLIIPFIVTLIFIKKTNLANRLPISTSGQNMLLIGGLIIIVPQLLRIFTATIPGGGASFALMSLVAPFLVVAKPLMFIGAIRLFMSVKPHESYEYK